MCTTCEHTVCRHPVQPQGRSHGLRGKIFYLLMTTYRTVICHSKFEGLLHCDVDDVIFTVAGIEDSGHFNARERGACRHNSSTCSDGRDVQRPVLAINTRPVATAKNFRRGRQVLHPTRPFEQHVPTRAHNLYEIWVTAQRCIQLQIRFISDHPIATFNGRAQIVCPNIDGHNCKVQSQWIQLKPRCQIQDVLVVSLQR